MKDLLSLKNSRRSSLRKLDSPGIVLFQLISAQSWDTIVIRSNRSHRKGNRESGGVLGSNFKTEVL